MIRKLKYYNYESTIKKILDLKYVIVIKPF